MTGASSDIGLKISKRLVTEGHEVIGLSRQAGFRIENAIIVRGDLQDSAIFTRYLENIDLVIHAAAVTHTDHTDDYIKINFEGTKKLVSLAETHGAKRFIFISTRAIGLEGGGYAASKFLAEESVRDSRLNWVILRLSEVYGTNKNQGIDAMINLVLRSKIIPIIGKGQYLLAPVFVDDVVKTVLNLTKRNEIGRKCYNICGPETYSMNELISILCRSCSLNRIRIHIPVFLFKVAIRFKRFFPFPFNITRDQIQRLQIPKDSDFSAAKKDLDFCPIKFNKAAKRRKIHKKLKCSNIRRL